MCLRERGCIPENPLVPSKEALRPLLTPQKPSSLGTKGPSGRRFLGSTGRSVPAAGRAELQRRELRCGGQRAGHRRHAPGSEAKISVQSVALFFFVFSPFCFFLFFSGGCPAKNGLPQKVFFLFRGWHLFLFSGTPFPFFVYPHAFRAPKKRSILQPCEPWLFQNKGKSQFRRQCSGVPCKNPCLFPPFFSGGCPTKNGLPQKGFPCFVQGH